eukprot:2350005-Pleurochrysis_carterae.AAC.1
MKAEQGKGERGEVVGEWSGVCEGQGWRAPRGRGDGWSRGWRARGTARGSGRGGGRRREQADQEAGRTLVRHCGH